MSAKLRCKDLIIAVANSTSYKEVGRPNRVCDELRLSLMYFFRQLKVIINTCLVVKNRTSNEEVGRPNTFCDEQ